MQALAKGVLFKMPIVSMSKGYRSLLKQRKVKPLEAKKQNNLVLLTMSNEKGLILINPKGQNKTGYSKREYYNNGSVI